MTSEDRHLNVVISLRVAKGTISKYTQRFLSTALNSIYSGTVICIPSSPSFENIHWHISHHDCASKKENSIQLPSKIVITISRLWGPCSNCKQITLDQRGRSDWSWVWSFLSTSAEDFSISPIWSFWDREITSAEGFRAT